MRCSQLSSTSRRCLPPTARATDSVEISQASFSPSVLATVDGTRPGSDNEASSTIPPVFKVGEEVTDGFDGERGLPDAAGARQGHYPIGRDEVSHKLRSRGPTDQARNERGKIVRRWRSGCAGQG